MPALQGPCHSRSVTALEGSGPGRTRSHSEYRSSTSSGEGFSTKDSVGFLRRSRRTRVKIGVIRSVTNTPKWPSRIWLRSAGPGVGLRTTRDRLMRWRNPVFQALLHKKGHLKRCVDDWVDFRGIFICDGDCASVKDNFVAPAGYASLSKIVNAFLQTTDSVDFVCVLDVKDTTRVSPGSDGWFNVGATRHEFRVRTWAVQSDRAAEIRGLLQSLTRTLPEPVRTAFVARHELDVERRRGYPKLFSESRLRGALMSEGRLSFSLRAALDLMAGATSPKEFQNVVGQETAAQLRRALEAGCGVDSVKIQRAENADDDRLEIDFRGYDAARAPFKVDNPIGRAGVEDLATPRPC